MFDLRWSWLCVPFALTVAALVAVSVVAAVIRGDRVMRFGVIGAALSGLPWALCSALLTCTDDPVVAEQLLRLGLGPVALVGPNLLLILLGLGGQLERKRWLIRLALYIGGVQVALCWGTAWTVPGVHRLTSGIWYGTAGPLTDLHIVQIGAWFFIGLVIARASLMRRERRQLLWVVVLALANLTIGATDILLARGVISFYPASWLPTTIACGIGLYCMLASDLLQPGGVDRAAVLELAGLMVAAVLVAGLAYALSGAAPIAIAVAASAVWAAVTAIVWWLARRGPRRPVFGERAIERFAATLTEIDDERPVGDWLTALWRRIDIAVRAMWRVEADRLVDVATGAAYELDGEVCAWLVGRGEPLAAADLTTMWVGAIRPRLEAWIAARGATLFVPLIDRDALVGLVEADQVHALRESERGLVAQSARAAARALTYVHLARSAAREGATAREVEVAEAMRRQASARHDDELGPWLVTAEYRAGIRTSGTAWCANLAGDGRLAILVTEGNAHGVAAALATAALTGAFVAATASGAPDVAGLIAAVRASAAHVLRGGEPLAAFVAIIDAAAHTIAWGCAGHPGALVIAPRSDSGGAAAGALGGGGGDPLGAPRGALVRGEAALPADRVLVVASSGVHGCAAAWLPALQGHGAASPQLAARIIDAAAAAGPVGQDLLAVVVRQRGAVERSETGGSAPGGIDR